ncbi:GNAT family N-acetyltransferase [Adhaeribacter radiodurans]|uniref:GNAT family N-acetyltransferase n=1 Tax=Adhaeribacter radiodurans TaxID=2745197 RepID=A0A7L7L3W0_9BACT|nr:GNAT family N-acetyltransferase [Adhaeribacter radiodurans]QMU27502.1 GNAT family N-acetyltransferase [Adhaeribacter radiodurans]
MIQFRDAQFSDYAAIAKLHAASWQQHYRGIMSDYYLDKEVEQERLEVWHQRLQNPSENQKIILAIADENLVGFSGIFLNNDPVFGSLIDNLHVTKNLQKSGIGALLLKESAKYIKSHAEFPSMYLWVFELNRNARAFYDRMGGKNFQTIETQNSDQTKAQVCRYIWEDVSQIL